jgi:CRISPR-associated endonuclease/helicase Cas3
MEQEKTLYLLNDLKSHPDKSLFNHLKNVGNNSKKILKSKNLNLDKFIDFETLKDISYLIGVTHDFGKATRFFQDYINEKDEIKRVILKNNKTHHAFISSIFTYYTIKEHLTKRGLIKKEYYKYLPIISFLVVKRHHGNLYNARDETYFGDDEEEVIKKQIGAINFDRLNTFYKKLYPDYEINVNTFKDNYKEIISEINNGLRGQRKLIMGLDKESTIFYYFKTLLLYSTLLDADKTDAANLEIVNRKNIQSNVVDKYKKSEFGKPKNRYKEVVSSVDELNLDDEKILSLNVPTGTGKTLTSLSFALKLRERVRAEKGYTPRIIYALPFLSIIDQNYDVFNDVLDNPTTDILLKHHHLLDIVYTTEDEFENIEIEKDISKSLLLIEGWNSEIVVTTFIQFFHSFISNRNRAIRKFHNMVNSIVILDEVQAIPHRYWLLLNESIRFFVEHFNTYFIFVTATQPLIFNEKNNEIKSLIKNKKAYFEMFDRVDLIYNPDPKDIEKFKEIIKKDILKNPDKDFLIVMNTIDSSKEIYNFIKEHIKGDTKTYYLSTNIVPKERINRVKEIKEKTKKRKIIVSTQLIEAGVDIDVDVVYRDFGPLDSINQVAGRCNRNNRNFGKNKGRVKVFILTEKENDREYYKYIYGDFITGKTKKVFEGLETHKGISEPKFLELNTSYFEKVRAGMSNGESKKILNSVKQLEFAELSKFRLIKDEPYKVDVFVELDKKAKKIWQKYLKIMNNEKLKRFEKKNKFLEIKKDFYDYVISVYKEDMEWLVPDEINHIENKDLEKCYDKETGFKHCEKSTIMY